jgi:hypothetical protein
MAIAGQQHVDMPSSIARDTVFQGFYCANQLVADLHYIQREKE